MPDKKTAAKLCAHTFVIPAYQNSVYLDSCVQSLLAQTLPGNIIITTSTPHIFIERIAEKYGLEYHVNTDQQGIAADWNFALSKSPTQLVTIAHQDDIYEPGYTAAIINTVETYNTDAIQIVFTDYKDIVNGQIRRFGLNAMVKHILLLPFLVSKKINNRLLKKLILLFGDPICCPSVTFNKAALGSDFKFDTHYQCTLDWLAWYQLSAEKGAFLYINKKLVQHRIHHQSETSSQLQNGRRRQEEQHLFELMWGKRFAKFITRLYTIGHKDNL
jgi:glycosyltransferase involved in cell wall biosynthesis